MKEEGARRGDGNDDDVNDDAFVKTYLVNTPGCRVRNVEKREVKKVVVETTIGES